LSNRFEHTSEAIGEFERKAAAVAEGARAHREALITIADQDMAAATARLRESLSTVERESAETSRAAAARVLAELDAKAAETTHSAFASLFKTVEWYEKKAHIETHTAIDTALGLAAAELRERARELSGAFAAELDHYSRSYVDHTKNQFTDAARETLDEMDREGAQIATTHTQSINAHIESVLALLRGETETILKQRSEEMAAQVEQTHQTFRAGNQQIFTEARAALALEVQRALGDARESLAAHIEGARAHLVSAGEMLQRELRDRLQTVSNDASNRHTERLENIFNAWLLATMARLNYESEQQIQRVAHAAEERLRDTCNQIFAGLGETLRSRMVEVFTITGRNVPAQAG
jgi:hypothetical protein